MKQFHTVEELLSSIDEVSGKKLKEKLEEFKEQALMSKELATITTEAPLEVSLDSLGYEGFDREAVVKIFKDLGFHSLLERIGEEAGEKEEEQLEEIDVMIKTDITDDLFASPASLVVEQLGDNYHEAPILGFSIVNEHGAFFIPEETAVQSDCFKEWAEDESKKKWVFDAKRAAVALRWRAISSTRGTPTMMWQALRKNINYTSFQQMKRSTEKERNRRFRMRRSLPTI